LPICSIDAAEAMSEGWDAVDMGASVPRAAKSCRDATRARG
jgi:hypothetical protein